MQIIVDGDPAAEAVSFGIDGLSATLPRVRAFQPGPASHRKACVPSRHVQSDPRPIALAPTPLLEPWTTHQPAQDPFAGRSATSRGRRILNPQAVRGQHDAVENAFAKIDHRRRLIGGEAKLVGGIIDSVERQLFRPKRTHRIDHRVGQRPVPREVLISRSRPSGMGYTLGCHFSLMLDRENDS